MRRLSGASVALLAIALLAFPGVAGAHTAAPEQSVEALFLLRHPAGLDRFVGAVSDPSSPRYRHYASVEKLVRRFGASKADRRATLSWLGSRGLQGTVGPTGAYVTAPLAPARAERLLPRPASASAVAPAAIGRLVPAALRGAVSGVGILGARPVFDDLTSAPAPRSARAGKPGGFSSIFPHSGVASGCAPARASPEGPAATPFTPNQYLTAYGHEAMHGRGLRGQGQTVALVEVDGFRRGDIATFDRCFGFKTPPIQVEPVAPIGRPFSSGAETTLDLELLSAGAPDLSRIDVYEGLGTEAGIMLTAGAALGSRGHHPDVISISLGICEPRYAGHLVLARAMDNIFAVAAGAGISTLVSAGDSGSSGCRVVTGSEDTALPLRTVSLPSSSPWVTAVGGTNFRLSARNRLSSEVVWNDWPELAAGGGGGISLLSSRRPWWQRGPAVARYGAGRVVPDVSALSDVFPGYAFFCTSPDCAQLQHAALGWTSVGGTSAAAPLTASGVVLADQFAAKHRQRPLGLLNPLLYRLGNDPKTRRGVFHDVTKGNNDIGALLPANVGGGHRLGCCNARPGYDSASGWGSLKMLGFAKAASHAMPQGPSR